jgi:predicted nucleic acid-binding protein
MKYRIYLDNCCFNRPYDDQTPIKIWLETQAKLHIQGLVYDNKIEIVWSFMLKFENSRSIFDSQKKAIARWEDLSSCFIEKSEEIMAIAKEIVATNVKEADAVHVACAIAGNCDYFITVDKRLLKYKDKRILIYNPIEFINNIIF